MPTCYCWYCYAETPAGQRTCSHCGRSPQAPAGTGYTDLLVWALRHPLPDRRLLAARILGRRGDPAAVAPLRDLVTDNDPYLAAAALRSLVSLAGLGAVAGLVNRMAEHGSAPVRAAARRALAEPDGGKCPGRSRPRVGADG